MSSLVLGTDEEVKGGRGQAFSQGYEKYILGLWEDIASAGIDVCTGTGDTTKEWVIVILSFPSGFVFFLLMHCPESAEYHVSNF